MASSTTPPVRHPCSLCEASFSMPSALKRHVKTKHGESPKFICDDAGCDKSFARKDILDRHKSNEHGDAKATCPNCQTRIRKDGLTEHMVSNICRRWSKARFADDSSTTLDPAEENHVQGHALISFTALPPDGADDRSIDVEAGSLHTLDPSDVFHKATNNTQSQQQIIDPNEDTSVLPLVPFYSSARGWSPFPELSPDSPPPWDPPHDPIFYQWEDSGAVYMPSCTYSTTAFEAETSLSGILPFPSRASPRATIHGDRRASAANSPPIRMLMERLTLSATTTSIGSNSRSPEETPPVEREAPDAIDGLTATEVDSQRSAPNGSTRPLARQSSDSEREARKDPTPNKNGTPRTRNFGAIHRAVHASFTRIKIVAASVRPNRAARQGDCIEKPSGAGTARPNN